MRKPLIEVAAKMTPAILTVVWGLALDGYCGHIWEYMRVVCVNWQASSMVCRSECGSSRETLYRKKKGPAVLVLVADQSPIYQTPQGSYVLLRQDCKFSFENTSPTVPMKAWMFSHIYTLRYTLEVSRENTHLSKCFLGMSDTLK